MTFFVPPPHCGDLLHRAQNPTQLVKSHGEWH